MLVGREEKNGAFVSKTKRTDIFIRFGVLLFEQTHRCRLSSWNNNRIHINTHANKPNTNSLRHRHQHRHNYMHTLACSHKHIHETCERELNQRERKMKYRTIWSRIQWHNWKGLPLFKIALHVCSRRTVHVLCCVSPFITFLSTQHFFSFVSFRSVLSPQVNFYWCYFSTHTHIAHTYSHMFA